MSAPIRAFVGPNGGGKTLAAMQLAVLPALNEGRQVVSTCAINHPKARLLHSWREMLILRDCLLLLDEISSELPSRGSMGMPPQLMRMINQLRKVDVECVWTAPNWARADVALREVTQEVTVCRGFMGDRWVREAVVPKWTRPYSAKFRGPDGRLMRRSPRWPSQSLFRWVTYEASGFDEFTLHAVRKVKPRGKVWYWRPWHEAQFLYDTVEGVTLMDHVDETGVCVVCGGARKRHQCSCSDSERRMASDLGARAPVGRHASLGRAVALEAL